MLQPRPILIADDDPDDLFFASRVIQKAGLVSPILTCADGTDVVSLLRERARGASTEVPEVVILDVKMPVMNGFDTLKWIRSQGNLTNVAVIMLSGSNEQRDTERAHTLGADGYMVKYPTGGEMARVVGEAIERRRKIEGG